MSHYTHSASFAEIVPAVVEDVVPPAVMADGGIAVPGCESANSLPMNHDGTHPRSPLSVLIVYDLGVSHSAANLYDSDQAVVQPRATHQWQYFLYTRTFSPSSSDTSSSFFASHCMSTTPRYELDKTAEVGKLAIPG